MLLPAIPWRCTWKIVSGNRRLNGGPHTLLKLRERLGRHCYRWEQRSRARVYCTLSASRTMIASLRKRKEKRSQRRPKDD